MFYQFLYIFLFIKLFISLCLRSGKVKGTTMDKNGFIPNGQHAEFFVPFWQNFQEEIMIPLLLKLFKFIKILKTQNIVLFFFLPRAYFPFGRVSLIGSTFACGQVFLILKFEK